MKWCWLPLILTGACHADGMPQDESPLANSISLGLLYVSEQGSRIGQFTGLDTSRPVLNGSLHYQAQSESADWTLDVSSLGTDARLLELLVSTNPGLKFGVGYEETTSHGNHTGRTPYTGSSNLRLPINWQTGLTTSAFDQNLIQKSIYPGLKRRQLNLAVEAPFREPFWTSFSWEFEETTGRRVQGAAFYFNLANPQAALLPIDVDESSSQLEWQAGFEGTDLTWELSYRFIDFNNNLGLVEWQNPYANGLGSNIDYPAGVGGVGANPGYHQNQISLAGAYRFNDWIRLALDTSIATTEQTGKLASYTQNPALTVNNPLPANRMDDPLINRTLHLAAYTQPMARLGVNLHYRYNKRDNTADRLAWNYVPGDAIDQPDEQFAVFNKPLQYEKEQFEIIGNLRFPGLTRLGLTRLGLTRLGRSRVQLGYEYEEVFRHYAAVEKTENDRLYAAWRFVAFKKSTHRIEVGYANKRGGTYDWSRSFFQLLSTDLINQVPEDQRWSNHPLLRQYHVSNNQQRDVRWRTNVTVNNEWSIQLLARHERTDYDKSDLGLQEQESITGSLSVNYAPRSELNLQSGISYQRDERTQRTRGFGGGINKPANQIFAPLAEGSNPARDYEVLEQSNAINFNSSLSWQVNLKFELDASYNYMLAKNTFDFESLLPVLNLPTVETAMHNVDLAATYHHTASLSFTGAYQFMRYQDIDYSLNESDIPPRLLTTFERNPNEAAHLFMITATFNF